ncbi:MAG: hypothetical protein K9W42_05690 [Candidatus Heimdallarchaeota archaeon]|nr:hypothetical protein [Candidatus Heimdallarchaeota archaeon]
MKRLTKQILIASGAIVLALGLYGFLLYGLWDFNDLGNTNGLRVDDSGDDTRVDHPYIVNGTLRDVGRAVGYVLWDAKGIDIIVVGILLFIASEGAATIVKGMDEQCTEFRTEMCETDKFVILERKDAEDLKEEET